MQSKESNEQSNGWEYTQAVDVLPSNAFVLEQDRLEYLRRELPLSNLKASGVLSFQKSAKHFSFLFQIIRNYLFKTNELMAIKLFILNIKPRELQ